MNWTRVKKKKQKVRNPIKNIKEALGIKDLGGIEGECSKFEGESASDTFQAKVYSKSSDDEELDPKWLEPSSLEIDILDLINRHTQVLKSNIRDALRKQKSFLSETKMVGQVEETSLKMDNNGENNQGIQVSGPGNGADLNENGNTEPGDGEAEVEKPTSPNCNAIEPHELRDFERQKAQSVLPIKENQVALLKVEEMNSSLVDAEITTQTLLLPNQNDGNSPKSVENSQNSVADSTNLDDENGANDGITNQYSK